MVVEQQEIFGNAVYKEHDLQARDERDLQACDGDCCVRKWWLSSRKSFNGGCCVRKWWYSSRKSLNGHDRVQGAQPAGLRWGLLCAYMVVQQQEIIERAWLCTWRATCRHAMGIAVQMEVELQKPWNGQCCAYGAHCAAIHFFGYRCSNGARSAGIYLGIPVSMEPVLQACSEGYTESF
eukprot:1157692-Pelagomonas_calceolata.AAC.4